MQQWFGTNTDVNELKRMEESLRAAQARLNSTLAGRFHRDLDLGHCDDRLAADEFIARMFSVDPARGGKRPARGRLSPGRPAGRSTRCGNGSGSRHSVLRPLRCRYRVSQENGELHWLQAKGRVEGDAAGKALRFHGAVIDITERKHSEARFRRLVDLNAQGVMFWNSKGEISGANDAFLRIVGYSREDEQAGRINWAAITPPEYADLDRRSLDRNPRLREAVRRLKRSTSARMGCAYSDSVGRGHVRGQSARRCLLRD